MGIRSHCASGPSCTEVMEPFQLGTEWTEDGPGGAGRCRRTWWPLFLPALDALLSLDHFPFPQNLQCGLY